MRARKTSPNAVRTVAARSQPAPLLRLAVITLAASLAASLAGCAAPESGSGAESIGIRAQFQLPGKPSLSPDEVLALDLPSEYDIAVSAPPALVATGFDLRAVAVRIRNVGCGELSVGSGFAIDEYTLVTNKHVVDGAKTLEVSTFDGHDVTVTTASSAILADLAVVRTADPLPRFPALAAADPEHGEEVVIVGYPSGGPLTTTQGRVLGNTEDPMHANLGQVVLTDATVEQGSSGSAALNQAGEVVGVVYAKTDDGRSMLIPVSTLRAMLREAEAFAPLTPCQ